MNLFSVIRKAILKEEQDTDRKQPENRRANMDIVNQYIADPEFPYLVSFSRTGSHWLRMMMELYLGMPSLKLLFFSETNTTSRYSCLHTHDLDFTVEARNVVYLYREPVETIFSQMTYHEQDLQNDDLVDAWADHYARHVKKWVIDEKFTAQKIVLTYEGLKSDIGSEFQKISDFFGVPFDADKAAKAAASVSKEKISEKTKHDPKVINLDKDYSNRREEFKKRYSARIYELIRTRYPEVATLFEQH